MENAFGDARKDFYHGIASILLIHVGETQHIRAVGHECTAQEFINKENVRNHIDQIQDLTEEIAERVAVVCAHTFDDVVDQAFQTILTFAGRQCEKTTQSLRNQAHFAIFPVLPNPMWHIEHASLIKIKMVLVSGVCVCVLAWWRYEALTWKNNVNGTHW